MYTLVPLTLLLLWNGLDSNVLQMPEMADVISKARVLCPYNSLCGEPPLSTATITPGYIPCCKDCSCRPDCYLRNDCCFPSQSDHSIKSECLYPLSPQVHGPVMAGSARFSMVTQVGTCKTNISTLSSDTLITTFIKKNQTHIKTKPEKINGQCGWCECSFDIKFHLGDECVCARPVLSDNDTCNCGEVQVAPWGSLFPVYSKSTHLIYKNPVCAACHGITDGIIWNPLVTCINYSLHFIEQMFDKCTVMFQSPDTLDRSRLPRCVQKSRKTCSKQNISSGYYLNMTADEIESACNSTFTSPFGARLHNVFCSICTNQFKTKCRDDTGFRFGKNSITMLLTSEFLEDKFTQRINKKVHGPVACSQSMPSDCRTILCPSGQVRTATDVCAYPMAFLYVEGLRLRLRLYPEAQEPIKEIMDLLPDKRIKEEHLITPWPKTWLNIMTLLETSRLMSSGEIVNTTSFIVTIAVTEPNSDIKVMLNRVKHGLEKKSFLKVNNWTIALRSEFLEHSQFRLDPQKNVIVPSGLAENEMGLSAPNWILQWSVTYPQLKFYQSITKLMFCEQVTLNSDEYSLTTSMSILYLKSKEKFFYEAEFVYEVDVDGDQSVRLCLDDTDFVKVFSSSQTLLHTYVIYFMISSLRFLIYLFFE